MGETEATPELRARARTVEDTSLQVQPSPTGTCRSSAENVSASGPVRCGVRDDVAQAADIGSSTSCLYVSLLRWNRRVCEGR